MEGRMDNQGDDMHSREENVKKEHREGRNTHTQIYFIAAPVMFPALGAETISSLKWK